MHFCLAATDSINSMWMFFFTPSTNSWTGLAGVRADTVTVSVIVSGVRHRVVITDDSNKKEKKTFVLSLMVSLLILYRWLMLRH